MTAAPACPAGGGALQVVAPRRASARRRGRLTHRGEVAVLDGDGAELVLLSGLEVSAECAALAGEELAARYHMPRIVRVEAVATVFGTHYWSVVTDCGKRRMALKEPCKNVTWVTDDRLILRDTSGNRFEIPSLEAMDAHSRRQVGLVL